MVVQLPTAPKTVRYIPLSYDSAESKSSAIRLILTLFPEWEKNKSDIEFIRFTDGITNTVSEQV
jgi:ethanolamine kinase